MSQIFIRVSHKSMKRLEIHLEMFRFFYTAKSNHFLLVADASSEFELRQVNYLSSIFYLKFRFYTQSFLFL